MCSADRIYKSFTMIWARTSTITLDDLLLEMAQKNWRRTMRFKKRAIKQSLVYKSRLIVKSVLRKHFCHADCINARIIIIITIIDHILRIFKINNTKPIDDKNFYKMIQVTPKFTLVRVIKRPRMEVTMMIPTRIKEMCCDQNFTCGESKCKY